MGIADSQVTAIGRQEKVRVHFGEGGKGRVIDWSKGAKGAIHEVGNGRGLHHGQLSTQDSGCIVAHSYVVTQYGQVYWLAGVNCVCVWGGGGGGGEGGRGREREREREGEGEGREDREREGGIGRGREREREGRGRERGEGEGGRGREGRGREGRGREGREGKQEGRRGRREKP